MQESLDEAAAAILANPAYSRAVAVHIDAMIDAYSDQPRLNKYMSDAKRWLVSALALHLHITRDAGKVDDGLTMKRLQALCAHVKHASPKMVRDYIKALLAEGFLREVKIRGDRRFKRMEPTERMIAEARSHATCNLKPVDALSPEIEATRWLENDPEFVFALRRAMARYFFASGNPITQAPEIGFFIEKDSGYMILLTLLQAAQTGNEFPVAAVVSLPFQRLARRYGVSRVHVGKIFKGAQERALVELLADGGQLIRPTERLLAAFQNWIAAQFHIYSTFAKAAVFERQNAIRMAPS